MDTVNESPNLQPQEIVVRLENNDGVMTAFALDTVVCADRVGSVFPDFMAMLPKVLTPAVDAFMFAIRHGILQKLAKDRGLQIGRVNSNAEAAKLLMQVIYHTALKDSRDPETGEPLMVDMTQGEFSNMYKGIFRRLPQYDALAGPGASAKAIESPVDAPAREEAPV